jgi:hypothetical protein
VAAPLYHQAVHVPSCPFLRQAWFGEHRPSVRATSVGTPDATAASAEDYSTSRARGPARMFPLSPENIRSGRPGCVDQARREGWAKGKPRKRSKKPPSTVAWTRNRWNIIPPRLQHRHPSIKRPPCRFPARGLLFRDHQACISLSFQLAPQRRQVHARRGIGSRNPGGMPQKPPSVTRRELPKEAKW